MLYLIYFILLLLSFYIKSNKYTDVLIAAFIYYIVFHAIESPDFYNYQTVYNYIGEGNEYLSTGIGWYYLNFTGNLFGISYRQFNATIVLISLMIYQGFISKYTKNTSKVWFLYMIFPLLLDIIQVRFLFSTALVLLSIKFILKNPLKYKIFAFVIILCAYTVHSSAIIYSLFIIVPKSRRTKKIFNKLIIIVIIITFSLRSYLPSLAVFVVGNQRLVRYFSSTVSFVAILTYASFFAISYVLVAKLKSSIMLNENIKEYKKSFVEFVVDCNYIIFLTLPLVYFSADFMRIQRIMWILNYIVLAIAIEGQVFSIKLTRSYIFNGKFVFSVYSVIANLAFIGLWTPEIYNIFLSLN